jgi:hypothetical protein
VAVWWALGAHVVVRWRLVRWRLRGSEVGLGRSRGGDVRGAWVRWRLRGSVGGSLVRVRWLFFRDRDESAKTSRCCGPYCDEFNKSS